MTNCPRCDKDHARGSSECPARRIGTEIADKYRLESLRGVGGLGAVYEAVHLKLGKRVAVKILHARFAHQADVIARFHAEAKRAADLAHPGIIDVLDFGQDDAGIPYLELELLDGRSVGDLSREGPLPIARAVSIVVQALEALHVAHGKGIVHRDLKPDNLFLARDERGEEVVKVLDFGLAKVVDDASALGLTQSGEVLGTVLYASPEQIKSSRTVDRRADLWSMGATLFELLTGAPAVQAMSLPEAVAKITAGDVFTSPRLVRADVPEWLDAIVQKAMRGDPKDRYATALEMAGDLAGARAPVRLVDAETLPAAPSAPAPQPPPRTRNVALALGGVAVAAAIAFVVWPDTPETADDVPERPASAGPETAAPPPPRPPEAPDGMVTLGPATFTMGSSDTEIASAFASCRRWAKECRVDAYQREGPERRVRLSPFFLDRTEVTHAAFSAWLASRPDARAVRGADGLGEVREGDVLLAKLAPARGKIPHYAEIARRGDGWTVRSGFERRPVTGVSWDGASRFCAAQGGDLPTEAQWELAARSARDRRFPWGDADPDCAGTVVGRFEKGPCGDRPAGTIDAGLSTQDRTAQGVSEMAGNVREWVRDPFADAYGACTPECVDPIARETGDPDFRSVRGASWAAIPSSARGAARSRYPRGEVFADVGFRCARPAR